MGLSLVEIGLAMVDMDLSKRFYTSIGVVRIRVGPAIFGPSLVSIIPLERKNRNVDSFGHIR